MNSEIPCACIATFDKKLAEHNTQIDVILVLGAGGGLVGRPYIGSRQIETGRGKKKKVTVIPTFCPFCGEPYEPQPAVPTES
jgi:hypothetical protein